MKLRLLIVAPVAVLAAWTARASATNEPIIITVYSNATVENIYNASPPLPPDTPIVGVASVARVSNNFDAAPIFDLSDDFVVHYEGWITTPTDASVSFIALADDGVRMSVNNTQIIDDWYDKGCCGSQSAAVAFTAGVPQSFSLWYYENGGGAWVDLWWNYAGEWSPVPDFAFIATPLPTTSLALPTTSLPPTTDAQTTTTAQQATTTSLVPSTTTTSVAPTSTSVVSITVVPSSTTTVSTTTVPETTTTIDTLVTEITNEPQQFFEQLNIDDLSDEQINALVSVVQTAPIEVRQAFEAEVNVFDGRTDNYVPIGSNIPVGARRVIVAATAVMGAATIRTRKVR